MIICVGVWVQYLFLLLGVDNVKFSPPYDKVCKLNGVGYVLMFLPRKMGAVPRRLFVRQRMIHMVY